LTDQTRIDFANTLRGFAAVSVLISHYFGVFWSSRPVIELIINAPALPLATHGFPRYISWLHALPIFNWGSFGVALFFIISGFVIPFSIQKLNWQGFVINRLFRIIPTYVVGFSISLAAIYISSDYFSRGWPFQWKEVLIHYIPGLRDLMWSRHIDMIVWTLEIEMKFYLLCALLIIWFRQLSLKVFWAPVVLFVGSLWLAQMVLIWQQSDVVAYQYAMTFIFVAQYIIFMFIGVMFHYLHRRSIGPNQAYFGIGLIFLLFCLQWRFGPYAEGVGLIWSYAFALLVFSFAYSFPNLFRANRVADFLADISYPLYVVHGVAGYVVLRILLEWGIKAWLALLVVTGLCLLVAWLIHHFVEYPSQAIGKRLGAKLSGLTS